MNNTGHAASDRVIVIGAGIGGLVAALELAASGLPVLLLERAAAPGGKMREVAVGGQRLDGGPTVFTMRWVFEALFDAVGASLAAELPLEPMDLLARHAWSADERLDLFSDLATSVDAIGRFAGAAEAHAYAQFCARAQRVARTLEGPFLRGSRPNPLSLTARVVAEQGWRGVPALWGIAPFTRLWQALGQHFRDPRLQQLFGRYATYCGASPFLAPATLMLVAHVEREGVWRVPGGMHRVAATLARLAAQRGAVLRYGCQVDEVRVRDGRAVGVRLAGGETIDAAAVVFNGDSAALAAGLLGQAAAGPAPARAPRDERIAARRSLSAMTWHSVAAASGFPLAHHTVFFGRDYAAEFAQILQQRRCPQDPTVYVCAQDRDGSGALPADHAGGERLMWLINAPPDGDVAPFGAEEQTRCLAHTLQTMRRCGLRIEPAPTLCTTPADFARLFPASGGALYGPASHGWRASFQRPGARSRLPGLYLAGGTTHPGPGVPMAALSGRQAVASLLADRASTRRWHPVVMPGGISTR